MKVGEPSVQQNEIFGIIMILLLPFLHSNRDLRLTRSATCFDLMEFDTRVYCTNTSSISRT